MRHTCNAFRLIEWLDRKHFTQESLLAFKYLKWKSFFPHDVRRRFYLIDRCVTFTRSFNAIWMNCNVYFLHASSVCLHLNLTIDFLQRNEHYLNQDQLSHFCTCNYLTVSAAYISNIDPLKIVAIIVLLTLLLLPIIEY